MKLSVAFITFVFSFLTASIDAAPIQEGLPSSVLEHRGFNVPTSPPPERAFGYGDGDISYTPNADIVRPTVHTYVEVRQKIHHVQMDSAWLSPSRATELEDISEHANQNSRSDVLGVWFSALQGMETEIERKKAESAEKKKKN
ncbi:hypothetical protein EV361DRAFT_946709 [Lentinula raphanica]|nr:hypothetical protein F5880DRAFT_1543217 [Lentinula raphanica]KAJ3974823.1 hypothetical protein EV361DRAFT_946709 [Lentinula raphanica]